MSHFGVMILLSSVLALLLSAPVLADQTAEESAPGVAPEVPEENSTTPAEAENPEKAKKVKKPKDPNRGRILPIPIFITEPAIGDGLGLVLAYFHRKKDSPDGRMIASPESFGELPREQAPPPTVSGIMGAYTSNGTAAAGIGHMNSFKDDHIRFTGVAALADINSTLYFLDQPFKFNLEGALVYLDTRFRIRDSRWFWGIGLSYLDASSAFQVDIPDDAPIDLFRHDVANNGLAAELAWDTRDSTSMPNSGQLFDFSVWRYDDAIGGDYNYWDARLKLHSFHRLHEKFILGLRLEYSAISGTAPFFAIPFVKLRGIPALRYQGERVTVAEIEGRYNFSSKWAMVGFVGTGNASNDIPILDSDQDIYNYGLGGRYKIFDAQNIWVGIDIARGPEDSAWYIQVGQAW